MSFINIAKFNEVHMEAHNVLHLSHIGVVQCSIPLRNQSFEQSNTYICILHID